MNSKAAPLRTLLLWSVVNLLVLASMAIPVLNILTVNILLVPSLFIFLRTDWKRFLIAITASFIVMVIVFPSLWLAELLLVACAAIPAVVMGLLYKRKNSAPLAIAAGGLLIVMEIVVILGLARLSGFDPLGAFKDMLDQSIANVPEEMVAGFDSNVWIQNVRMILPAMLISFSAYFAWITHVVARRALRKSGTLLPALPKIHTWMLPRSMVWYFLILLVVQALLKPEGQSMLNIAVINLYPLMTFMFSVQALSFLFYMVRMRKWNRSIPWIAIALFLVWGGAAILLTIIGVLDTAFPLRERLSDKS